MYMCQTFEGLSGAVLPRSTGVSVGYIPRAGVEPELGEAPIQGLSGRSAPAERRASGRSPGGFQGRGEYSSDGEGAGGRCICITLLQRSLGRYPWRARSPSYPHWSCGKPRSGEGEKSIRPFIRAASMSPGVSDVGYSAMYPQMNHKEKKLGRTQGFRKPL